MGENVFKIGLNSSRKMSAISVKKRFKELVKKLSKKRSKNERKSCRKNG